MSTIKYWIRCDSPDSASTVGVDFGSELINSSGSFVSSSNISLPTNRWMLIQDTEIDLTTILGSVYFEISASLQDTKFISSSISLSGSGVLYPPTNVVLTQSSSINITWDASVRATGYNIYKSYISGSAYSLYASSSVTNFTDITSTSASYYVITATNKYYMEESAYSIQVEAIPDVPCLNGDYNSIGLVNNLPYSNTGNNLIGWNIVGGSIVNGGYNNLSMTTDGTVLSLPVGLYNGTAMQMPCVFSNNFKKKHAQN